MLPSSSVVKQTAKTVLKGNMLRSVTAASIAILGSLIANYIVSLVAHIVSEPVAVLMQYAFIVLLTLPLFLGLLRFFRRMQWGINDDVISVFHYFSGAQQYKRALNLILPISVQIFIRMIIFSLPVTVLTALSNDRFYKEIGLKMPAWAYDLQSLTVFFEIIAIILVAVSSLRLYLAPFLYVADEDMDYAEALHRSKVISKRTRLDFAFLVATLLLWILLSVLLVPFIFTLPYFMLCYLVHCRFAVAQYNATVSSIYNTPFYSAEI